MKTEYLLGSAGTLISLKFHCKGDNTDKKKIQKSDYAINK